MSVWKTQQEQKYHVWQDCSGSRVNNSTSWMHCWESFESSLIILGSWFLLCDSRFSFYIPNFYPPASKEIRLGDSHFSFQNELKCLCASCLNHDCSWQNMHHRNRWHFISFPFILTGIWSVLRCDMNRDGVLHISSVHILCGKKKTSGQWLVQNQQYLLVMRALVPQTSAPDVVFIGSSW